MDIKHISKHKVEEKLGRDVVCKGCRYSSFGLCHREINGCVYSTQLCPNVEEGWSHFLQLLGTLKGFLRDWR